MKSGAFAFLNRRPSLVFWGVNSVFLTLFLIALVPFYELLSARDAEITDKRQLLARLQSVTAREAEVQQTARDPEALREKDEFLAGVNEGVISADLQTRLKAVADRSGARIRTIQSQPAQLDDPVRYIGARLTVFGTLQQIHAAIHDIETSKPYLFVTDAAIKSIAQTPTGATEGNLEARLDVFGASLLAGQQR